MSQTLTSKPNTICAWATAAGRAGVAILRLSGPEALTALPCLGVARVPPARLATLVRLVHPATGEVIDEALAIYFPAPHSFTGEDVLELHTHGSPAVMKRLTETLCALPAFRLAEPGEFSRRACLNGKFDLAQAEGLADLINAETESQRRQALHQMQGHLSTHYDALRHQLLEAMALMEAYIDFPDEEIPEHVTDQARNAVTATTTHIAAILGDSNVGEKIRSGIKVVILGAPNVGKSSLLNALAKREVAIVSHQAGTTRDIIEVELDLHGYRVILTDTAGLRETDDAIEQEGIRRALTHAEAADIKIILCDATALPLSDDDALRQVDDISLLVVNKMDLLPPTTTLPEQIGGVSPIAISLREGVGIDRLIASLSHLVQKSLHTAHHPLITQARHRLALQEAQEHLRRFRLDQPLELITEDLRMAAQAIVKITGKITTDEILDVVFARFCIGK